MKRFPRLAFVTVLVLCAVVLCPALTDAQTFARRRVAAGEVTGLEMGIEGSLRAIPGGEVRWFVSLYEVLRRRDLQLSPGSTLRVTASFARGEPIATVTTDARGRAEITMPIPADVEGAANVRVEATSPRHVRRVFTVQLEVAPRQRIDLFVDRASVVPGATVAAFGRATDRLTGLPIEGLEVVLSGTLARRAAIGPLTRTTDAAGVFAGELTVPAEAGEVLLEARAEHASATVAVTVASPEARALWLEATVEPRVAAPGTAVAVDVLVRDPHGAPIANAEVLWVDAVEADGEPARTDASGHARLPWRLPSIAEARIAERERRARVISPAHGSAEVVARVRVARVSAVATFAVEGGALVPGLASRVFVRVVGPDGAPLRDRDTTLDAPALGGRVSARTDADGVAVFEGSARSLDGGASPSSDGCGGPTAVAATFELDRHRERFCLPLDPDATLTVGAATTQETDTLAIRVARRASVARSPVEVVALVSDGERWRPLARVLVAPGETSASLVLPPAIRGEVWLRARPILDDGRAARGGGALVWRGTPRVGFALEARSDGAHADVRDATVAVYAVEASSEEALRAAIDHRLGPVGAAIDAGREPRFVAALLAARTPVDVGASVALREGEVVVQPLPQEPVVQGLLRDPWRTRARFVRGRIGRLMRAVEDYVDEHLPDDLEEVAVREGRGWRFNHALLEAALESAGLGEETAAALDGEPLDIDALTALDAAFTYDHVARRITRERLWRVHTMLRQLVHDRGLDRPWARRGDPAQLVVSLVESPDVAWSPEYPERSHLFDGWGQPFVLRPVRGRARFDFLQPVPGWELASAGPDGRLGTGDDVVDPFARVLPSSGLYAEAVSEDVLLARLGGVALGRATVGALAEVFEVETSSQMAQDEASPRAAWEALPAPLGAIASAPAIAPLARAFGGLGSDPGWTLPTERRAYAVVALRFGRDGTLASARDELVAGAPWSAQLELPEALRVGEELHVPLTLARLADGPEPTVDVNVVGGAIRARLAGRRVVVEAVRPGLATLSVSVRSGTSPVASFEQRVRVVPDGNLHARHAATMVAERAELRTRVPEGALAWRGEVVIGAPRAVPDDPLFAPVYDAHPALDAWVHALRGEELDAELATRVRGGAGPNGDGLADLDLACALVAWTATNAVEAPVAGGATHLEASLGPDLGVRAAVLAALASAAPGVSWQSGDPIGAVIARLRQDGWRALATASDRPAIMARMAAALLLSDREDAPGRALLARVRATLTEDAQGRRWVPGDPEHPGDGWVGTLALTIAARQIGDDALADDLARSAIARLYLVPRLSADDAFWALAASVYGAFGVDGPDAVEVEIDGSSRRVALEQGLVRLPLRPGSTVAITASAPVWARTESRFLVPFATREDGPLRARIEGTAGVLGDRAGFEIVVENVAQATSGAPVVEITLPGAAGFGDDTRQAIARVSSVRAVSAPDGAGVVRILLEPLAVGATLRVPLPLRWIASGRTRGLALATYDGAEPSRIATSDERLFTIEEEP